MTANEFREKNMFLLDAGKAIGTLGHMQDIGIDKAAFTFFEGVRATGKMIVQFPVFHIKKLYFVVPMPGKGAFRV